MAALALLPATWDPYKALDLNPSARPTCIGQAKSSRDKAGQTLDHQDSWGLLFFLHSMSGGLWSLIHEFSCGDVTLATLRTLIGWPIPCSRRQIHFPETAGNHITPAPIKSSLQAKNVPRAMSPSSTTLPTFDDNISTSRNVATDATARNPMILAEEED
jgi:hypothetical protein